MRVRLFHVPMMALPMVLAACGGSTPAASPGDGSETPAGGDLAAFCDAWTELLAAASGGPDIDWENVSEEEAAAAEKEYFENEVFPHADDAKAAVGDGEIADAIDTLKSTTSEMGGAAFESEDFQAAWGQVGRFMFDECEADTAIEYQAVDYGYSNAPTEVAAGTVKLAFTNTGEEMHESIHLAKKEGVDKTWEELLAMEEDEAMQYVDFIGASFAPPGAGDYQLTTFEPGEHVFVCFVPVGSTPDAEEGEEGPPHFTQGMIHEFTVTG